MSILNMAILWEMIIKISGISSIIADIGKWVKNSSDEQHFTMTTGITAILRQMMK